MVYMQKSTGMFGMVIIIIIYILKLKEGKRDYNYDYYYYDLRNKRKEEKFCFEKYYFINLIATSLGGKEPRLSLC